MPILIASLLQNGLGLLGNALLSKGKDVIEKQLDVKLDMNKEPSTADLLKFQDLQTEHEEFLLNASIRKAELELDAYKTSLTTVSEVSKSEGAEVSARWNADMVSDSKLSKNIRPYVLLGLLGVFIFTLLASALGITFDKTLVELLGELLKIVFGAYYGGRTVEKIAGLINARMVQNGGAK